MRRGTSLHRVVWDRDFGEIEEQFKLISGAKCFRQKGSKCVHPEVAIPQGK